RLVCGVGGGLEVGVERFEYLVAVAGLLAVRLQCRIDCCRLEHAKKLFFDRIVDAKAAELDAARLTVVEGTAPACVTGNVVIASGIVEGHRSTAALPAVQPSEKGCAALAAPVQTDCPQSCSGSPPNAASRHNPRGRREARSASPHAASAEWRGAALTPRNAAHSWSFRKPRRHRRSDSSEADRLLHRTGASKSGRHSTGASASAGRAPGPTTMSGERFRARRPSQTPGRSPLAHGGRDPFPGARHSSSRSQLAPPRSTRHGAPSRSGPRAN